MSKLQVELCPETGMCSIIRDDASKADLMPDEVVALREAGDDPAKLRAIVAASDAGFAAALTDQELRRIVADVT
jgi:hypothetical protein